MACRPHGICALAGMLFKNTECYWLASQVSILRRAAVELLVIGTIFFVNLAFTGITRPGLAMMANARFGAQFNNYFFGM
jgi:hypothetical protein